MWCDTFTSSCRIIRPCDARSCLRHFGPENVLLTLDITFQPMSSRELARSIDDLERLIRRDHPEMDRIYIEVQLFELGQLPCE